MEQRNATKKDKNSNRDNSPVRKLGSKFKAAQKLIITADELHRKLDLARRDGIANVHKNRVAILDELARECIIFQCTNCGDFEKFPDTANKNMWEGKCPLCYQTFCGKCRGIHKELCIIEWQ